MDSPLDTKLRMPILCSPSPLRSMHRRLLSMSPDSSDKGTQRKLYEEETIPIASVATTLNAKQTGLSLPTITPFVAPTRWRVLSLRQGGFKRPKQSGSFSTVASTPSYDSWEIRSLELQKQQQLRKYVGQIHKGGYSRGPEILKAMEKQRNASCS